MNALAAELLRTRRSPAAWTTLTGVAVCVLSLTGQLLVSERRNWTSLIIWHVPYVTGFAAVLTALLAALVERRERRSRTGGTAWRAASPAAQRLARLVVLAALHLVTALLVFLPFAPAGLLLGLSDPPVGRLVDVALLVWASNLGWLVLAAAAARVLGPWPVVGLGIVWQGAGTVLAESDRWWLFPPAWGVRPALPSIGAHATGVPLEPDSSLWQISVSGPLLASLLLAVAALPFAVLGGTAEPRQRTRPIRSVTAGPHVPLPPLVLSLRRTAIGPLTIAAALLLGVVARAYPPSYADALFGLVVLPGGAAVLAVLAWQAQEPAWRIVLTRAAQPYRVPMRLLGVLGAAVAIVAVLAGVLLTAAGMPVPDAAGRVLVAVPLGWACVALTLWLHARLHIAVALVVAIFGTTGGLLFSGSTLATTPLWLAGPAGWAYSATTPGRMAVAVGLSLAAAALAGTAFVRTTARA